MENTNLQNNKLNNIKLDFEEYKLLEPDYLKIDNQDKIKME